MRYVLCLCLTLALAVGLTPAAAPVVTASAKGKPADVYGLTKVWTMHLTVQPKDFETMAPTRGGFGFGWPPRPNVKTAPLTENRKLRGGFGFDFEYVKADLSIDGAKLNGVGVRYKGSGGYAMAANGLKKPFRIDFDRFTDGLNFKGVRKLNLNSHAVDPSAARESLGYALYREAGLATARTAYAEVYLTVPGKYDREFLGLYTVLEAMDRPFFKANFNTGKGTIFKPERVGPLEYVGEDWKEYETRYRPKNDVSDKVQKKLMDLCWLVQRGDDKTFRAEIGKRLDVDGFLRYLACTVLLSSFDSFVGLGHNYYLYHEPKKDRFAILPWDLDHSFGGMPMFVQGGCIAELSVKTPQMGRNRLVERILAQDDYYKAYVGHLQKIMKSSFNPERIKRDFAAINKVTAEIRAREKKATEARKEKPAMTWGTFKTSADLPDFVSKRVASVESQLAGKSKGTQPNAGWFGMGGEPLWLALCKPLMSAADTDKDGQLTKAELVAWVKELCKELDATKKGELSQADLTKALEKTLPKPPAFGNWKSPSQAPVLAKAAFEKAGKDGKLTTDNLVSFVEKTFVSADRDKDGKLSERELAEALRLLIPTPPPFGMPAPKKEEKK